MLSIDLDILTLSLAGAALLCAVAVMTFVFPRLRRVRRAVVTDTSDSEERVGAVMEWPAVSVIVHARSDASALSLLLPQILGQDYQGAFEVIVVNDGSDDAVTGVIASLEPVHRNLYMTFAPARSRNLSRKKLAITLGVKAARYDTVILLDGNTRLRSSDWLSLMMSHVARGKEIVAGYGFMVGTEGQRLGRLSAFDSVRTSLQYLGSGLRGRLYRAFGSNLAFSRNAFFDNKGFSGSLNLRGGHDDIFVSSISSRENFALELADGAMVEIVEEDLSRIHRLDKLSHDFTAGMVSRRQRRLWGFVSLVWWLWTACSVGTIVAGLPSLVPLIAVTVVSLALCIPLMVMWRHLSTSLHSRRLTFTVPFFFWIYPFYSLFYRIIGRRRRSENYTWSGF